MLRWVSSRDTCEERPKYSCHKFFPTSEFEMDENKLQYRSKQSVPVNRHVSADYVL